LNASRKSSPNKLQAHESEMVHAKGTGKLDHHRF
jgi:hypothetical protein